MLPVGRMFLQLYRCPDQAFTLRIILLKSTFRKELDSAPRHFCNLDRQLLVEDSGKAKWQ